MATSLKVEYLELETVENKKRFMHNFGQAYNDELDVWCRSRMESEEGFVLSSIGMLRGGRLRWFGYLELSLQPE